MTNTVNEKQWADQINQEDQESMLSSVVRAMREIAEIEVSLGDRWRAEHGYTYRPSSLSYALRHMNQAVAWLEEFVESETEESPSGDTQP